MTSLPFCNLDNLQLMLKQQDLFVGLELKCVRAVHTFLNVNEVQICNVCSLVKYARIICFKSYNPA